MLRITVYGRQVTRQSQRYPSILNQCNGSSNMVNHQTLPNLKRTDNSFELLDLTCSFSNAMVRERKIKIPLLPTKSTITTNLSNACGHGSFILMALGYLGHDVLYLRLFTAGGIVLSMLFQYFRPQPLWIPIRWNALFFLINSAMIALLVYDRQDAEHLESKDEKEVFDSRFASLGLGSVQFLHLIRLAEVQNLKEGETFAQFDQPSDYLYLIIHGSATVLDSNRHKIAELSNHQFINSREFLNFLHSTNEAEPANDKRQNLSIFENVKRFVWDGKESDRKFEPRVKSQSTVVANKPCHVFAWNFQKLRKYLKSHSPEESAMQISISADLTKKLEQSRDPQIRYRQLLVSILSGDEILPNEKMKLQHYRKMHKISQKAHESLLEENGWSIKDFENGYREHSAVSGNFSEYEKMLKLEISDRNSISEEGKANLRKMRRDLSIDLQKHLLALKRLGWSYEDYEVGCKEVEMEEGGSDDGTAVGNLKRTSDIISDAIALVRKKSNIF